MTGTLIVSTPKASMHALAFQGIMVYNSFPQIRDMLMRRFGDEYVLLFARPVENAGDGQIDWYSPVQGTPQLIDELPDETREEIYKRLGKMGNEILKFAEELISSGDPLRVTRGNILKLALNYPSSNCLYVVGEQPVFTCWGFGPGTPGVVGQNLTRCAAGFDAAPKRKKIEEVAPTPVPVRSGSGLGWLWWLLPLFLLAILFFHLVTGVGGWPAISGWTLFRIGGPSFVRKPPNLAPDLAEARNSLENLQMEVERHAALCLKEGAAAPSRSLDKAGLDLPSRTPLNKADLEKPSAPQLVIPENAKDAAFMSGQWRCDTGLANTSNEAVQVGFSFDDQGKGKAVIFEANDQCVGDAAASMENGMLKIHVDEPKCEKSDRSYMSLEIECKNAANNQTECSGINKNGSAWAADFRKLR